MNYLDKLIGDIECHNILGIRDCFENGINPNDIYDGKPLIFSMIDMYLRGPNFPKCIQVFVDFGLEFQDKILLNVLLDNAKNLELELAKKPELINKKYNFNCTFTPLIEASLLHICAEYNLTNAAKILIKNGANVNEIAGFDSEGFGGQTPIFHTVNQHNNVCIEMLNILVAAKADVEYSVKGLIWGKGYEWETYIPSVNPISYAIMGLLRQFQRIESDIYEVVHILQKAAFGIDYSPKNVPNKYLYG